MKLKCRPEDFQVDELMDIPLHAGDFAVYRLTKRSMGTPEAIAAVAQRWKIPRRRISFAGLKDKHAVTTQFITISHGPRRSLQQKSLGLEYLGQTDSAMTADQLAGNRFQIVLRDMGPDEARLAISAVGEARRDGLPNYFDDQRFGSLSDAGEWIARALCLGQWERALWLALADSHPDDRSDEKQQKALLRSHWGRWSECNRMLARSHRRRSIAVLAESEAAGRQPDFRGAFAKINVDIRGLYLSAWQSALWNQVLSRCLDNLLTADQRRPVSLLSGAATFFTRLTDDQRTTLSETSLPLPCARQQSSGADVPDIVHQVLAEDGLELRQLRIKHLRDSFFSKGSRAALVFPQGLNAESLPDDLYPGRQAVRLGFDLPRGSYATVLVKRITAATVPPHGT